MVRGSECVSILNALSRSVPKQNNKRLLKTTLLFDRLLFSTVLIRGALRPAVYLLYLQVAQSCASNSGFVRPDWWQSGHVF